jgi:beta-hydroxylase
MYYDPQTFAFARAFEASWEQIRDEYRALDAPVLDGHRTAPHQSYVTRLLDHNGWLPSWQAGTTGANPDWLTYGLSFRGVFPREAYERYPVTAGLLSRLRGFKVCAFSLMRPRTFIAPHRHPELGGHLLTYHLGLDVTPRRSYLCVDGVFAEQQNGRSLVFDGSCDHFALNMSDEDRVILYLEFDRAKIRFD